MVSSSLVRIPVRKTKQLESFGYHAHADKSVRHKALRESAHKWGTLPTFHRLLAIANLNHNIHPDLTNIYRSDMQWIEDQCDTKDKHMIECYL